MKNKLVSLTAIFVFENLSFAKTNPSVKTLYLNEQTIVDINVSQEGSILSFPVKPTKVILGKKDSFSIEYVENDLAIAPTSLASSSNLFIYMLGRRYSFSLSTKPGTGDEIVLVRDSSEKSERSLPHE